jgi:4,5-DOPA dioxygenase extradiol
VKNLTRRHFLSGCATIGGLSMLSPLTGALDRGSKDRAPALFIGHGDPMNVIQDSDFTREWQRIGALLASGEPPLAILCISAHWQSNGTLVSTTAGSELIYDFYGFPKPMYELQYPAPGFPGAQTLVAEHAGNHGIGAEPDRGLDHGAWCVLSKLYPEANVPVFQLSLSREFSPQDHYTLAREISALRDRGVLIIGSGNLTHNMRSWQYDASKGQTHLVHEWAQAFDQAVADRVLQGDHATLVRIAQEKPSLFSMAHPTTEHYLPLLYTLGAQHKDDEVQFFAEGFEDGSFSMRSVFMS